MTTRPIFHVLRSDDLPPSPVVVTISHTNGTVQGEIDRELLVVGGSISLPEHRGPMSVPDALTEAQEIALLLKPVGGSGVYIKITDAQLWNETWGELS